jgi:hypothetical protein
MNLINRDELKTKLDRGDEFKLVMTLTDWAFQAKLIPGSLNLASAEDVSTLLEKDDEIVVYCSDENCIGSKVAYDKLTRAITSTFGDTQVELLTGRRTAYRWTAIGPERMQRASYPPMSSMSCCSTSAENSV